ncbi:MAG TPA: hypothetical protein IAB65_05310 [Candidatus Onthocola stercorigallinarum]|nr:hypothetical protein [Candidatus Onthocola stercorigallinarum]
MKKENLIVILGGVIFLAIGLVITFNIIEKKEYKSSDISASISDNKTSNKVTNDTVSNEENKVSEDNIVSDEMEEFKDTVKDNTTINKDKVNESIIDKKEEIINNTNTNTNNTNTNNSNTITYSDKDTEVINSLNDTLSTVRSSEVTSSFKDSAKATFISVVDFLFYDGEINGVTFDELSDSGKKKVLEIASSIDSAIENKFPGYKETISDKASNAFNKASEIIKKGANDLNDFAREKLGEDNYQSIIDAKDELVYYTKNAINFIGDVSSSLWNSAKDKLNNWYQNFKNNN